MIVLLQTYRDADLLTQAILRSRMAFTVRPLLPTAQFEIEILQPVAVDTVQTMLDDACIVRYSII